MSATMLQPYHVGLYAREWVDGPLGSLPSTTPTIYVSDLDRQEMTAEEARQHAAVLREAADHLLRAADSVDRYEAAKV